METLQHHLNHQNDSTSSPSPEMFSFPGTPTEGDDGESEFEFGSCVTPGSPTEVTDPNTIRNSASPADQFFLNGRLLPHDFPTTTSRPSFSGRDNIVISNTNIISNINSSNNLLSRGTSVGSNMSKDSLTSSRSNSTNSSRGSTCSTCSSARTSSGEVSDRRVFQKRAMKRVGSVREYQRNLPNSGQYQYCLGGSLRRWQFITPVPMLGPSRSSRVRKESGLRPNPSPSPSPSPRRKKGDKQSKNDDNGSEGGFLQRILRSLVATCKACHAMQGPENEFDLDAGVLGN